MIFIPRLKILQNKSRTEEKNTKSDAPVKLKTEETDTTIDVPVKLKTEETNTTRDVPVKLERSNTIYGQIVRFIKDLPDWLKYFFVGLAWVMYPLYKRLRKNQDEVQESVQSLLQVVERVAQVTEKLATDIAEALPTNHNLKGAVETVSQIAHKVEKDAETAQAFVKMVDDLGDELDEYLNPLIRIGDTFMNEKIQDKKAKKENKDQFELTLDAKL